MKNSRRLIWAGVVLAGVLAAAGLKLKDNALQVSSAQVARGPLSELVVEEGKTRVENRYVVSAPVTGLLTRIAQEEGEVIKTGDPIARIFPAPKSLRDTRVDNARLGASQARRKEASAHASELEARIAQLSRNLARSRALLASGAVAATAVEDEELTLSATKQQLAAAKAAVRAAAADTAAVRATMLSGKTGGKSGGSVLITAPATGQVLRVIEQSERVVPAGTPLIEIGDAAQLEVVIDVLSEDAVRVAPGAAVSFHGWGGEAPLRGKVKSIAPQAFTKISTLGVEEQRVIVLAALHNPPSSLGSGYRLESRIVTWSNESALLVPTSALFKREGQFAAFGIQAGKAKLQSVSIGHRSTEFAEVTAGLSEGEPVILFPSAELTDGTSVSTLP